MTVLEKIESEIVKQYEIACEEIGQRSVFWILGISTWLVGVELILGFGYLVLRMFK